MDQKTSAYKKSLKKLWGEEGNYSAEKRFKEKVELQKRIDKRFIETKICTCGKKFERIKHSSRSHCSSYCFRKSKEG
jgi:hypothetical protein